MLTAIDLYLVSRIVERRIAQDIAGARTQILCPMQFVKHTNQQRILCVVAQLLYGQFTLWNLWQQARGVLCHHTILEHMEETGIARTEISMYAEVADNLTEQVPTQVLTLHRVVGQIEPVWQIAFHESPHLVIHLYQILPHRSSVVIANTRKGYLSNLPSYPLTQL